SDRFIRGFMSSTGAGQFQRELAARQKRREILLRIPVLPPVARSTLSRGSDECSPSAANLLRQSRKSGPDDKRLRSTARQHCEGTSALSQKSKSQKAKVLRSA